MEELISKYEAEKLILDEQIPTLDEYSTKYFVEKAKSDILKRIIHDIGGLLINYKMVEKTNYDFLKEFENLPRPDFK